MSHADQVMTRDSLMELIWGIDFFGESRTLDMHIRTPRKNLVKPATRYKRYEMSDIVSEKRRMKQNEKRMQLNFMAIAMISMIAVLLLTTVVFYNLFQNEVIENLHTCADMLGEDLVNYKDANRIISQKKLITYV